MVLEKSSFDAIKTPETIRVWGARKIRRLLSGFSVLRRENGSTTLLLSLLADDGHKVSTQVQ